MAIGNDFSIAVNGDIRHTSGTATYTMLELHRWLMDLADDASETGDDNMAIAFDLPSSRSTDKIVTLTNSYNIDDTAAQYLYDGSLSQDNGDTLYAGLVVVGAVEAGTQLQLVQDNALLSSYWGTGLNADAGNNILLRLCVKVRSNGVDIDGKRLRVQARELGDKYAEYSLTMGEGNNTAAVFTSVDLNNQTAAGTISGWSSIVNVEGLNLLDVDNNGVNEEYYSQWDLGSQTINDLYERTKWLTRRGSSSTLHGMNGQLFRGITHSFAYDGEGGTGPVTNDTYAWGLKVDYDNEASGPFAVGDAVTIGGDSTGRVLDVDDNGLTGSLIIAIETDNTPADNDQIAEVGTGSATADVFGTPAGQATGGGVGTFLAVDDDGTTGNLYMQLLKGSAPANNAVLYKVGNHADTVTVNGTVTSRTVSPEFLGVSTGSAIVGAYGIGIQIADLTASDQLFDLTNTQRIPPNNVTFTVSNLVAGGEPDYVLVTADDGSGGIDYDQYAVATAALTGVSESQVTVGATISNMTPASGTIRIQTDSGIYKRVPYSSFTGAVFTFSSPQDFSTDNASISNNVFVSYIDKQAASTSESATMIYVSDLAVVTRVRNGGPTAPIKEFQAQGTVGSAGGSSTVVRTSDL